MFKRSERSSKTRAEAELTIWSTDARRHRWRWPLSDQRLEAGDDVEQLLVDAALAQAVELAAEVVE
jgi:hypothetical protein